MRTLYQAANGVEAHMLVHLLRQHGITGHIRGEFLQGAVGELPAAGLVRIEVDEDDHARAREVIEEWERSSPPDAPSAAAAVPGAARPVASRTGAALLGLLVGLGAAWAFFRSPISVDGVDHTGDGVPDERWTYSASGAPLKSSLDRDFDGRADQISFFNARGFIDRTESDDDFDGRFETHLRYHQGNVVQADTDADGDGLPDLRTLYVHGVPDTMAYFDKYTGRARRVEHLRLGRVVRAEVDVDGDGRLDTREHFDRFGTRVRTELIEPTDPARE